MGSKNRIDWPSIRREYVEGVAVDEDGDPSERRWPSLGDLCVVHGVGIQAMNHRSSREHWGEQRAAFQADVDRERKRRLIESRASQAVALDGRALTAAEAGIALVGMRLQWMVTKESQGERGKGVSGTELASLGLAARRWLQVKAAALGQPDPTGDEFDGDERDLVVIERVLAARLAEHVAERAKAIDAVSEET